jgi:hypothetical protein
MDSKRMISQWWPCFEGGRITIARAGPPLPCADDALYHPAERVTSA